MGAHILTVISLVAFHDLDGRHGHLRLLRRLRLRHAVGGHERGDPPGEGRGVRDLVAGRDGGHLVEQLRVLARGLGARLRLDEQVQLTHHRVCGVEFEDCSGRPARHAVQLFRLTHRHCLCAHEPLHLRAHAPLRLHDGGGRRAQAARELDLVHLAAQSLLQERQSRGECGLALVVCFFLLLRLLAQVRVLFRCVDDGQVFELTDSLQRDLVH
mmetsp:Transcript_15683/g.39937  ORF Transcript_15683/g.39937 Transcript_15683/m.39937 type:complete len:213 (+) Transcript_15683:92-730(+)